MFPRQALILSIAFTASIAPATAQNTSDQFRPELGIYLQEGLVRIEFVALASGDLNTHEWQGDFTYYIEGALKPVLRRKLRENPDVFRDKYLTIRAGYRYQTGLTNGNSSTGNIGIIELTSRYLLPWQLVISDRNRGDFRFIKGQAFSTRYRNRFRVERDIKHGDFLFTPYVYDEIFYDTRYDGWTPNRYAVGVELPACQHFIFDLYYMRQNGGSNPSHLNVFGFKWNLYF